MARIVLLCLASALAVHARLATYPGPAELPAAPDFEVTLDGKPVYVFDSPVAPYVHFSFDKSVRVSITARRAENLRSFMSWGRTYKPEPFRSPIGKVDVRPQRLGIQPAIAGDTITFELKQPANLSIEVNGNITRPLFLFAAPLETRVPKPGDAHVRYFAPGRIYDVGRLKLESGETIYIAGGAVVRGAIVAEGVRNARIAGRGVLDGGDAEKVPWPLIEIRKSSNVDIEGIVILNDRGWTVVPRHSEDIRFAGIKMIAWNNNSDGIDIVGCRRLSVSGSFFRNNDDCIPIKAAEEGSDIAPPPPEKRGPTQFDVAGIDVRDSVFWNAQGGNGIEIGFELRTRSITDVSFRDCDIIHVQDGAAISIHNGDWATVQDVRFENIRIEDSPDELFDIYIGLSMYSGDCPREYHRSNPQRKPIPMELRAEKTGAHSGQWLKLSGEEERARRVNRGHIRNILFRNIEVTGPVPSISRIVGYDEEHAVDGVTIEGLSIQGKPVLEAADANFVVRFAKELRFLPRKR